MRIFKIELCSKGMIVFFSETELIKNYYAEKSPCWKCFEKDVCNKYVISGGITYLLLKNEEK